jgi:hypothetical protein
VHEPRREQARMNDDTCQNSGRMNAHTCSTLVGTPAFAQPARALAPASGQVRRTPSPSAVPARAFKASPGARHLTLCSPSLTRRPSIAPASFSSARHHCPSLDHRDQPAPVSSSLVAREAFPALGLGRTSLKTQDRLRQTSVARLRA